MLLSSLTLNSLSAVLSLILGVVIYGVLFRHVRVWSKSADDHESEPDCNIPLSGNVLLIVDGSNGPIRLHRSRLVTGNIHKQRTSNTVLSFLKVVNGENQSDRMSLLQGLHSLLATHSSLFENAEIYFDGLGLNKNSKRSNNNNSKDGQDWNLSPWVTLKITPLFEEADGLILKVVQRRHAETHRLQHTNSHTPTESTITTTTTTTLRELRAMAMSDSNDKVPNDLLHNRNVYTLKRTSDGPGKSRQMLKPYTLLRGNSYFCLFGLANQHHLTRDVQRLSTSESLFQSVVNKYYLGGDGQKQTIVVSDDVHLRERVVEAGGFVMTFEQLWELLSSSNIR